MGAVITATFLTTLKLKMFCRGSLPVKHSDDQHVFLQAAHFDVCGRLPSRQ